jgi:hypothetical protein
MKKNQVTQAEIMSAKLAVINAYRANIVAQKIKLSMIGNNEPLIKALALLGINANDISNLATQTMLQEIDCKRLQEDLNTIQQASTMRHHIASYNGSRAAKRANKNRVIRSDSNS